MFTKELLDPRILIEKLEKEHTELTDKQILKLASDVSIPAFAKICDPNAVPLSIPDVHYELYDLLMTEDIKRLAAALPRGLAKSTIISYLYPLWKVLTSPDPEVIAIISESSQQAKNFLDRIKNALNDNEVIKSLYGDYGETTAKRWRDADIILKNGNRIVALGTGQKIRGFIKDNTRITIAILDDVESELNANTPEARYANRMWIMNAVTPSLINMPKRKGRLLCIGTIISDDCFLCYAKNAAEKENSKWHVLWKAVIDEYGQSIWSDMYPLWDIEAKKNEYEQFGNLSGFYQEYMNIPQSPEEAPFKEQYFRTYNNRVYQEGNRHQWWIEKIDKDGETVSYPLDLYMGVDLSSSLSVKADFTVLFTIGVDPYDNIYCFPYRRFKADPAEHAKMIFDEYMKYRHRGVFIESVAYQEQCRMAVRKMMFEKNVYIPGLERKITHSVGKKERLLSLVPLFARGKIYFLPGEINLVTELKAFPKGRHDDIIDALWLAISHSSRPPKIKKEGDNAKKKKAFLDGWSI